MKEERRVVLLVEQINRILDLMGPEDEISFVLLEALESKAKNRFTEEDMRYATRMYELIAKVSPETRKPVFAQWANEIRKLREIDGRSYEDIARVFKWANLDPFWGTNIKSPAKLREKWDKLDDGMRKQSRPTITAPSAVPYYKPEVRT